MDLGAGSSGKGKMSSYLAENSDNFQFACSAFMPQAGHWVVLDDGRKFFYQTFNSNLYAHEKFEKYYLGPGAMIELPALWRELKENGVPQSKIGISPFCAILDEELDQGYERGTLGFDGAPVANDKDGLSRSGTTAHGVGSCSARKMLRRPSLKMARDIPALAPMICDVSREIADRLDRGQSGLLEIAQGFQLSLNGGHYPFVTSRNCTVPQAFSDMMLPTKYAGQVIGNLRTFPIRINSNKYKNKADGSYLTWAQVQSGDYDVEVFEGNSGNWYPDQTETSWEKVTVDSGSPFPITEITSVTKLPRRVATFSNENIREAIAANDTGHKFTLSLNFVNYVDHGMTNVRGGEYQITDRFLGWLNTNVKPEYIQMLELLGTGAATESTIDLTLHGEPLKLRCVKTVNPMVTHQG